MCAYALLRPRPIFFFFFFNDTATTEIYTLSLHDALPISAEALGGAVRKRGARAGALGRVQRQPLHQLGGDLLRSEEHTSELQSPCNLVCRLLLEKKKKKQATDHSWRRDTQ